MNIIKNLDGIDVIFRKAVVDENSANYRVDERSFILKRAVPTAKAACRCNRMCWWTGMWP